jgi:hypothetical protein
VVLLQVQYVPDGHGGFLEIFDDSKQGGLFAVNAMGAQALQDCLDGKAVPIDESNMMFADGVNVEEIAKCVYSATYALVR